MKKKNIVTIVLVILAAASVAFSFYMKHKLEEQKENPQASIGDVSTRESSEQEILFEMRHETPLIKASESGYFYSFDDASKVTFYKFEKNELKKVTDSVKTVDISVPMSDDTINTTVYYIQSGEKLFGYGVFTDKTDSSVKVYSFILFNLVKLPNGDTVLLVNSDPSTAYSNQRVWDDMFEIDLESGKTERYFSNRNRGVDITGAHRRDFFVTTEDSVSSFGDELYFFSSRDYQTDESGKAPFDIFLKNGSGEEKVATGAIGYFVAKSEEDEGLIYIKQTASGFSVFHSFEEEIGGNNILSLPGDYNTAYARSGNYLLDKENGVVYSLLDGSKRELKDYSISAMTFSVSEDGNTVLLTGTVTNALEYGVYTYDFKNEKASLYIKDEFETLFNPTFITNDKFAYTYRDGENYKTVISKV
ncbi:MAG: hypothetical protein E7515_04050 [Ruminococcaceae bacterium]|jgi:hypothetical protein|nr:hypothetical protein [Oscillospiraceae bacterium]